MSKWKVYAKKATALVLSGILFGGVSGGVFTGIVNAQKNSDQKPIVNAVEEKDNTILKKAVSLAENATGGQSLDVTDVVSTAMPSVVAITNKSVQEVQNIFSMFGYNQGQEQEVESSGSGIIIGKNDTELLIVTNNHVVENAQTLSVCFMDENVCEAAIKGTDVDNDLAVIAVKLSDIKEETMDKIKVAALGDSDVLQVGEQVVAIGNALGYGQSTTTGIVSAVNRKIEGSNSENGFIQTDAAINPGNSGGALLNMKGEVIGINSAKLAATTVEGIGYAIPVTAVTPIIQNLMNRTTRSKVEDGKEGALSISGQSVDNNISKTYGIPLGVYVGEVKDGGAAQKAGIMPGYVITSFDGVRVRSIEELKNELTYYEAGETVKVTVQIADNGEYVEKELTVVLDAAESTKENVENHKNDQSPISELMPGFGKEGLFN